MLTVKGKYLFENGKPFFWLGDTAWLIYENVSEQDMEIYLRNRAGLGYNVLQTVLFYTLPSKEFITGGMPTNGIDIYTENYFALVDRFIAKAEKYGIYIALLPCWGSYVKNKIISVEDVDRFSDFLTKRFSHNKNLIWILGGDIKGDENLAFFNAFGAAMKKKDSKHLITYHPFGRTLSARWFNGQSWLDFNMFQSGHRRYDQAMLMAWDDQTEKYYGEDNWRYVDESFTYNPVKPVLDAEPSYEGIVQGLHDNREPYWEAHDVRRYAYWSVLQGACGFTYGNNAIIQFYVDGMKNGAYGIRETWKDAIHAEGGAQLQYLKALMEEVNFTEGAPREDLLVSVQKERYHRISVFGGKNFLLAYTYCGDGFELSMQQFKGKKVSAYWVNPQNGSRSFIEEFEGGATKYFHPCKRHELSNDWLLLLKSE